VHDAPDVITIDTNAIPARERMSFLRDELKDTVGNFDVELLSGAPMRQVFHVHSFATASVVSFQSSPVRVAREADQDFEAALSFNIMRAGDVLRHEQLGRAIEVRPGQGFLNALYEPFVCGSPSVHDFDMVRLSRRELATRLPNVEAAIISGAVRDPTALALLSGYLDTLKTLPRLIPSDLAAKAQEHIYDLVALAVGPSRDGARSAQEGGLKAARGVAVRRHVAEHLTDPQLSTATVARRFAISERYLRTLFDAEDGFWDYVVRQRLELATRLLIDPRMARVKIIDIAYRCGFNSVSAFNRAFAARYSFRPSSLRG
jgi:AraC-like DNA-binding protein